MPPASEAAAYEWVKDGVRGVLLAPRKAVFPALGEVRIERSGNCTFRVRGYVDSANLLGVLLRAEYQAGSGGRSGRQVRMRLDGLTTREARSTRHSVLAARSRRRQARREGSAVGPEGTRTPNRGVMSAQL